MNGYKTGGDWTDVTSIGRNEVVFEGRHKAYGAFYIRQRYPSALLFAMLSAIAFMATCAFIANAFQNIYHMQAVSKPDVVVKPTDVLIHRQLIIPPPAFHPPAQPHKTTPNRFMPPVITNQPIDSIPSPKQDEHPITPPVGSPGSGNEIPSPLPTGGSPLPSPADNQIRTWVNEMPVFPGGDIEKYLAGKTNYPPEEAQLGVQGTVYASFIIEKDGSVSTVKLVRGISNGQELNEEALRVLSEMPKWSPGKQDGHPVRIQYIIPIHFKIQ